LQGVSIYDHQNVTVRIFIEQLLISFFIFHYFAVLTESVRLLILVTFNYSVLSFNFTTLPRLIDIMLRLVAQFLLVIQQFYFRIILQEQVVSDFLILVKSDYQE